MYRTNYNHPISLCLYRVTQETLHNILTHSQAHNVQVELDTNGRRIRLTITDDGLGFDLNHAEAGLGLISMRQRVVSVGGTIDITSSPNEGTAIEVRVPLRIDDIPSVA
jgi:signal transduction histidine kinase